MSFRATQADSGVRLDAALADHGIASSRSAAQRLIESGLVAVDGRTRPKSHQLVPGQTVVVSERSETHGANAVTPADFSVAFEDEDLLVIDKAPGVAVHPGAGREQGTLAQALRGRVAGGPDPARAGIVHRLDRDTSGLLVVSRSDESYAALQGLIRRREMAREYVALVEGQPDALSGTIDAPVGRDRGRRTVISTRTDRPRHAVTHFSVTEQLARTTLLAVRLETGRTHQIRAHLAAIGHPVCGDERYGGAASGRALGLERQFLHSARLMFIHPLTGEQIVCESRPPADLLRALEAARRDPVPGGPDGD